MERQTIRHRLAALGTTLLVVLGASSVVGDEIRIWPEANIEAGADVVRLKDVADIRGYDAHETERIAELVIQGAPRPGGANLVHASDVRAALSEAEINLGATRVFGSSRCKVNRPRPPRQARAPFRARRTPTRPPPRLNTSEPSPGEDTLKARLRDYILARLPNVDGRIEIQFSRASRKELMMGGPKYRFTIRSKQTPLQFGLLSFDVDIQMADARPRTVTIVADAQLMQYVVVARRPINHGQVITQRDLKLEERGFSRLSAVGLSDLPSAVGLQSRRFIRPGDMLKAKNLQARPLVKRGDVVKILVQGFGLEIKTSGKAQSAGTLGDVITVRRNGTRRKQDLIDAVVAGPGLVTYGHDQQLARR